MKRLNKYKIFPSSFYVIYLIMGFGAGFATKEFVHLEQKTPTLYQSYQSTPLLNDQSISVCFTPNKQCQSQILSEINKAKISIYVQGYSFTDKDIAAALTDAARRGVKVQVLLDKSNRNDSRSAKDIIIQSHIPLRFDSPAGIAHNKIIVLDEATVISGSYNFSAAAYKRNTENLLVLNNKNIAQKYLQNWQKRWALSKAGENKHGQSFKN